MKTRAVAHSLAGLGEAWNATHGAKNQVRLADEANEKPRKCRKCGGEMTRLPNTNVWVCGGTVEVADPTPDNPDAKTSVKCGNIALSRK